MPAPITVPLFRRTASSGPVFSPQLLERLDKNGPRYTSYPTADRYNSDFGPEQYREALLSRVGTSSAGPLSLYMHIPFCESVCYYCACNKVVTRHHDRAALYLDALEREIDLHTELIGRSQAMSQLHFGGGTPTFLSDAEFSRLMDKLRESFKFLPDAEISIEVDPRTASPDRLAHLKTLGFNRLSFGVQDFDAAVQQAVHRVQPYEDVRDVMISARELGFTSINVDLIYGLPKQTLVSFAHTVSQVRELRPDRIALYAYAHLPQRFKPQRRILAEDLPLGAARVGLLSAALSGFLQEGYVYIGMDHFALPDDTLAIAKQNGRLHRNFQGYSTQPDCDLIALGVSAIGRCGNSFSQNVKTLEAYYAKIAQGQFPIERGLQLSADDKIRQSVIMEIMCQGQLDFDLIENQHGLQMESYFAEELGRLDSLIELGLVTREPQVLRVTELGWYFVRAIAMVFDRYLNSQPGSAQYSRLV